MPGRHPAQRKERRLDYVKGFDMRELGNLSNRKQSKSSRERRKESEATQCVMHGYGGLVQREAGIYEEYTKCHCELQGGVPVSGTLPS